jgi:mRNA-degrading endonuclease RelE of RelBE toxin-antitoxin system
MNYEILRTDAFAKHFEKLSRKYSSAIDDYEVLLTQLSKNPFLGQPLGKSCYKIRMAIKSKRAGKSGGARVITYVKIDNKRITLLDIYDKSEKENITDKELEALIKSIP